MLDRRRARDASDHVPVRPRRPRLFAPLLLLALCLAAGLLALAVAAPAARAVSTTGDISGTVTDASHAGLAGIIVSAYRSDGSGGWTSVNDANTASDGSYDIGGLAAGTYRVAFTDYSGAYVTQYYNNKAMLDAADDVNVTAGSTTSGTGATLALAGDITGTVTDGGHIGIAGISVTAYRSDGAGGWTPVNDGGTANDGSYDVGGLATGTYRVRFWDGLGLHATQWYSAKASLGSANDVLVTSGTTSARIDATLADASIVDNGIIWSAQDPGSSAQLSSVSFGDAAHGWAVGGTYDSLAGTYRPAILATVDGGQHWTPQRANSAGWLASVSFPDAVHGWAVGSDTDDASNTSTAVICATSNGGQSWATQDPGSASYLTSVVFADATHGWAAGSSGPASGNSAAIIIATSDGGLHWSTQYSSGDGWIIRGVAFPDATHGWAVGYGSAGGFILATSDGGAHWSVQKTLSGWDNGLSSVAFVDTSHGWAVGGSSTILVTADGGEHWTPQDPGGLDVGDGRVFFSGPLHGWILGNDPVKSARCLTTTDGGATWKQGPAALAGQGGMDFVNESHGFAVGWMPGSPDDRAFILAGVVPRAPALTSFTPASGPAGTSVTLTGTNLTGTTAVKFNGTVASVFTVTSVTQITATVPAGATTGTICVTTPGGTGTSTTSFMVTTPVVTPTLTLTLSGLGSGSLKLGQSVTASGAVTPTSLAGSQVTLTAQLQKGAKWIQAKTFSALVTSTGAYSWKYKPAKKGAYRLQGAIAKTATHTAATTKWLVFKVK